MAVAVAARVRLRTRKDGQRAAFHQRNGAADGSHVFDPVGMARLKPYSPFAARSVCRARTNGVTKCQDVRPEVWLIGVALNEFSRSSTSVDLNTVRAKG